MGSKRTAAELWQDYLFLTREMAKFLAREEMELFHELLQQREDLQTIIEETPDDGFRGSPEGRKLLAQIQQENQALMSHFQHTHQKVKQHHQVAQVYTGGNKQPVGNRSWEL